MRLFLRLSVFLTLLAPATIAVGYIGPGSGISVVGSLLGLLATILLAFGAILLWPYRRMMKKRLQKADGDDGATTDEGELAESEAGKK